jgi:DNA anti-recombination protein RmuC
LPNFRGKKKKKSPQISHKKLQQLKANNDRLRSIKDDLENDIHCLLQQEELESTKAELASQNASQISDIRSHNEISLRALMEALLRGCEEISLRSVQENETLGTQTSAAYYIMIMQEVQDLLEKLKTAYGGYSENCSENAEALAVTVVNSGHMLSLAFDRGMTIANASTNMVSGESE